jgi:regulator of protease activity HflC (stomatin/prohibitin superfamily)
MAFLGEKPLKILRREHMKKIILAVAIVASLSACSRVPTGEVGLRVNFDKTVDAQERLPGSFNQTIVGDIIKFPVKEIAAEVSDLTPLAADNSTMKDFDVTFVYNINPASVSDLYVNKSHSFHTVADDGTTYLMHSYLYTTVRNAVYKVAREYPSLQMNDSRSEIEQKIMLQVKDTLKEEKLDNAIVVSQVQVKSIQPSDAVKDAANRLVQAKSEYAAKEVEVQTAKKEAERIAALNANAGAINYMQAQAQMKIAEGIAEGKVQTVVIPYDFKGMVNVGKN